VLAESFIEFEKEILAADRDEDTCDGLHGGWDALVKLRETVRVVDED
jgi:hypothetical protein